MSHAPLDRCVKFVTSSQPWENSLQFLVLVEWRLPILLNWRKIHYLHSHCTWFEGTAICFKSRGAKYSNLLRKCELWKGLQIFLTTPFFPHLTRANVVICTCWSKCETSHMYIYIYIRTSSSWHLDIHEYFNKRNKGWENFSLDSNTTALY